MAIRRYIAGHTGLVGAALLRRWNSDRRVKPMTATHATLDLIDPRAVEAWLAAARPDEVVIAAGRVGGIAANASEPASFIYENLMIATNLIHGAWKTRVRRLLNFGSSCVYPKQCPQPMRPDQLGTGLMEPTSEPYATAKWAGMSLCAAYNRQHGTRFITAIPATVYGPGDHFDLASAHVLSALMRKFHDAKTHGDHEVTLWGSGEPRREFLYSDDLAEACDVLLERYEGEAPINVGSGTSQAIRELAALIAEVVGFEGTIRWDRSQPDGAPEKSLDSSAIRALGWAPRTSLRDGIQHTYQWFLEHQAEHACASS